MTSRHSHIMTSRRCSHPRAGALSSEGARGNAESAPARPPGSEAKRIGWRIGRPYGARSSSRRCSRIIGWTLRRAYDVEASNRSALGPRWARLRQQPFDGGDLVLERLPAVAALVELEHGVDAGHVHP